MIALAVIPTCGDCAHARRVAGLDRRGLPHACAKSAKGDVRRNRWKRVDVTGAPPSWCPFRVEAT